MSVPANPEALSRALTETKVDELRSHLRELTVSQGTLPAALREASGITDASEEIDPAKKPTEAEKPVDDKPAEQPTREFSDEEIEEALQLLRDSKAKGLEIALIDPAEVVTEDEKRDAESTCPWMSSGTRPLC